jgi:hypothetical protein
MQYNSPIYPSILENGNDVDEIQGHEGDMIPPGRAEVYKGLSIREHYAGLAMQALISFAGAEVQPSTVAKLAVAYSDRLIEELMEYADEEDDTSNAVAGTVGDEGGLPDGDSGTSEDC